MLALGLIRPSVTAMWVITSANAELTHELKLPPYIHSLRLISADPDDVIYVAADEATRQTMVEVVYGRLLYTGAAHDPPPAAGEVPIMLDGPDLVEVRAGLGVIVVNIENGAVLQRANNAEGTAFLVYVVPRTGPYLPSATGTMLGDPMAYLVAPPLEATYGIDAASKSVDVQLATYVPPLPETNYSAVFLTGSQAVCKAACGAFTNTVLEVARNPIQRA